jgi:CRISPR-associated protein Cas1
VKRTLALTEAGASLHVEKGAIQLERPGQGAQLIDLDTVGEIILVGRVDATGAVVRKCLRAGVPVVLLDGLGRYLGRLVGPTRRHAALRIAQVQAALDPARAIEFVRVIVRSKLQNQRNLLVRRQRTIQEPDVARALARIRQIDRELDGAATIDVLRGLEGAAAAAYFGVFGLLLRNPTFTFEGRNRRPPRDPVNAMLSFGYTVLGSLLESEIEAVGLDPAVGFLHLPHYGRPSLMLDLLEELRPVVDRLTLKMVNLGQLTPGDFGPPEPTTDEVGIDDQLAPSGAVWADSPEDLGLEAPTADRPTLVAAPIRTLGEPWIEPGLRPPAPDGPIAKAGAVYLRPGGRKLFLAALFEALRDHVHDPIDDGRISLRLAMRRQVWRLVQALSDSETSYVGLKIDP